MNRRTRITLTEEEWQRLEAVGRRGCRPQHWPGHWRSKLVHRAIRELLERAERQGSKEASGEFRLEPEFIRAPAPVPESQMVRVWNLFGRGDRDPDRAS